jgi:hypothetical protein
MKFSARLPRPGVKAKLSWHKTLCGFQYQETMMHTSLSFHHLDYLVQVWGIEDLGVVIGAELVPETDRPGLVGGVEAKEVDRNTGLWRK